MTSINRWPRLRIGLIVVAVLALIPILLWASGWGSHPQMRPDGDVFKSVDALFTAVTSRHAQRLSQCKERLGVYRAEGRLPAAAAEFLEDVIRRAESGGWESAARRLYRFIEHQRYERAAD